MERIQREGLIAQGLEHQSFKPGVMSLNLTGASRSKHLIFVH